MRITNRMMTNKYIRNANTLATDLDKLNQQVSSGRKFSRASEDTAAAVKAYRLREDLSKGEGYQSNIMHAKSYIANAESTLMNVQAITIEAKGKIVQALNSTNSQDERHIIATEIRNIRDQLLQALNSSDSGEQIFGGSNRQNNPFTLDASGRLVYNDPTNSATLAAASPAELTKFNSDAQYVDIGLNPEFDGTGKVISSTVFSYSVPGTQIMKGGESTVTLKDGSTMTISNNLYDILTDLVTELDKPDSALNPDDAYNNDKADAIYGKFNESSGAIVTNLTNLGSQSSYLDFSKKRLDTLTITMQEKQVDTEGIDPKKVIIDFKSQQLAYETALKMGSQILKQSIFDYMS